MSDKPSYLGLLNAIATGELRGEELFSAWATTTRSDVVRQLVGLAALREAEHARSFAKRMYELGFTVQDRPDPEHDKKMKIARSRTLTDQQKMERLGFSKEPPPGPDVFSRFFEDTTMDIETGALMGRYISEERDTGRRFRACYASLTAPPAPARATARRKVAG